MATKPNKQKETTMNEKIEKYQSMEKQLSDLHTKTLDVLRKKLHEFAESDLIDLIYESDSATIVEVFGSEIETIIRSVVGLRQAAASFDMLAGEERRKK
jgi:hypothetical protein